MIVGTAGHIDHGKTSLVKALTGVDTDRLAEEKRRGITIDLGFAYKALPNGEVMGFVDVPGHERFVHNMLAGVAGIDFVLLVVAADDGPMPQTVEHLQIVDLLGIDRGLVALTKTDMVSPQRLAEARGEVQALLASTRLAGSEILPVSSVTGEGLDDVSGWLELAADDLPRRRSAGHFRLAVDRCFTLSGAGTVVTGTVVAGEARLNDPLVVSPGQIEARLRGIHAQNRPAEVARAGERCALNLVGSRITKDAVTRGDWVVAQPAHLRVERFDALYRHLASETRPMRHWTPVHVHLGAADAVGRVALLQEGALAPGEEATVQIVLERPIGALQGDRFILRDQSAVRTIGGGRVLDPFPPARGRRTAQRLAILEAQREFDPAAALARVLALEPGWTDLRRFIQARNLSADEASALGNDVSMSVVGDYAFAEARWAAMRQDVVDALKAFHEGHPELPGLQTERLRTALARRVPAAVFTAVAEAMVQAKAIVLDGSWYRLPSHTVSLTPQDTKLWSQIEPRLRQERFSPPRVRDFGAELGVPEPKVRDLLKRLGRMGKVVEVAHDHFFLRDVVAEMIGRVVRVAAAAEGNAFSAAQFRDEIAIGRKVAIQVLEFYDRHGITVRRGDLRKVHPGRLNMFGSVPSSAQPPD
jgi:selenocysteine-specific elongation factor